MGLVVLLLAWCAVSVPVAMLAGRFLRNSSRHDGMFVRTAQAAVMADQIRRTAS
jgi:hypothetical protein